MHRWDGKCAADGSAGRRQVRLWRLCSRGLVVELPFRAVSYRDLAQPSWRRFLDCRPDGLGSKPDLRPCSGQQHDDAQLSALQVLLVAQVLIGRHKNVVPVSFREVEQFAVVLVRPGPFRQRVHGVLREEIPQRRWRSLIEQQLQGLASALSDLAS